MKEQAGTPNEPGCEPFLYMPNVQQSVFGLTRVCLGWIFVWAFLDKLWGLGFATESSKAWLRGGSPTAGFLQFGTEGPLVNFYQSLAGSGVVDWLFMMGLLGIGLALMLGIMLRVAAISGVLFMILLYASMMPPENNPLVDEHVIYALLLVIFALVPAGEWWGLGHWWASLPIVQKISWLK